MHFIGIGGVHMSALARMAQKRGFLVSGSDTAENTRILALHKEGIRAYIGHDTAALHSCDAVVYTLAISPEDPEYRYAVEHGILTVSRADFLGFITNTYQNRIGVSGSHGKSTVCAMLAEIFRAAGRSPTVFCGAEMAAFGSAVLLGEGKDCIFEACEYSDSLLSLSPTVALVLNLDFDHADYFADLDAVGKSFSLFAKRADCVISCAEDVPLQAVLQEALHPLTFGLCLGDCKAEGLFYDRGCGRFFLHVGEKCLGEIRLCVPGEHNVKNALAAALAASHCGIEDDIICHALSRFSGAERRMSYRGKLRGAPVFDDYAHHPTEITASIRTARSMREGGRVLAVFQPHTFSRTAALFDDFCQALSMADRVLVCDIYPARETDTLGMSAERLAEAVGEKARYAGDFAATAAALCAEVQEADTVLLMGAGDVDRIFTHFCAKDFTL